jgi:hypothetical protein
MPVQGWEDWDFWLGALEHGSQFAYVPEVLFDYRVSEQSMITRARGFGRQVESFIPIKHGLLYRHAWRQELESVTATFRNLGRSLASGKYLGIQSCRQCINANRPGGLPRSKSQRSGRVSRTDR